MKFIKMMIQITLLIFASYLLNLLNFSWSSQKHHSKNKTASQERSHDNLEELSCWSTHSKIISFQSTSVFCLSLDLISSFANTASLFFLILSWFYLITVLLLFHSILSCASCILLSLKTATFFKRNICYRYNIVTASS